MRDLMESSSSRLPPPLEDSPRRSVLPLEYAPPAQRPSRRDAVWGVVISILLANGVGWLSFGMGMVTGMRDDYAGPIAVGLASITLGLGLAGTWSVTRRFTSSPR